MRSAIAIYFFLVVFGFLQNLGESQKIDANGKLNAGVTTQTPSTGVQSHSHHIGFTQQPIYVLDDEERFCRRNSKVPFYQRYSDGAICCHGKELPIVTVQPETEGECAISTKTGKDGILDSSALWCSYTCSLKKLGAIDTDGKVVPEKFLTHLAQGLSVATQAKLKTIMRDYLGCFKALKNPDLPCYTPLGFQKCYRDALIYICTHGMPKNDDFSSTPKIKAEYEKLKPFCYYNKRRITPGCCHGKPLPWTITEILEAPRNDTQLKSCLNEMGNQCDATCFLLSQKVLNDDLDLDVDMFSKKILTHFPAVKPSAWMDYTGPVFLFYDEVLVDMGDEVSESAQRVCRFHDRVMELHESKVDQYCEMTVEEVKELVQEEASNSGRK